jgi:hypothetical protein
MDGTRQTLIPAFFGYKINIIKTCAAQCNNFPPFSASFSMTSASTTSLTKHKQ